MARVQERLAGRYELNEVLGRGGMGIVYKARDRRLDRVVAIKVLRLPGSDGTSGVALARFLREARAVARLQHAHIVQIYDIGEHDGLPYVALELVSGSNLAEKLRKEKP